MLILVVSFGLALTAKPLLFPCSPTAQGTDCVSSNTYWSIFWGMEWVVASFWFGYLFAQGVPLTPQGPNQQLLFASILMSGVIGGAVGWLGGVFFFPIDSTQAATFDRVGTMVGSFVSGYLLKEFTQILQYLTGTAGGPPLILRPGYRECTAFFFASLLVSGGVQVAVRSFSEVQITWEGIAPDSKAFNGVPRFLISPGDKKRLAGMASGYPNSSVRWRLEASDADRLQSAVSNNLIAISQDGTLQSAPKEQWAAKGVNLGFDFEIIASSTTRPDIGKVIHARVPDMGNTASSTNTGKSDSPSIEEAKDPKRDSKKAATPSKQ